MRMCVNEAMHYLKKLKEIQQLTDHLEEASAEEFIETVDTMPDLLNDLRHKLSKVERISD